MAIYHLSAKVVSRAKGQSVVAAAAYRAGEASRDDRYGLTHDYTRKAGVEHSEILLPRGAPARLADRQTLWNEVEAKETRKDSQLARELEIGLPVELTHGENVALVRDYLSTHFVSKGMIADFSVHEDDPNNPHAHVLLTMREVTPAGFGKKVREWNARADLLQWRASWAEKANEHLALAGHAVRIDHRTLEAQNIELEPSRKIGVGQDRQGDQGLPKHVAERIAESNRIAAENGRIILADPTVALRSLTHQRATFTERDVAKFLHTRTHGAEQFQEAILKVMTSDELVSLGKDDRGQPRYTTKEMLDTERSLFHRTGVMAARRAHGVDVSRGRAVISQFSLSEEQENAFAHITSPGDLKAVVGVAGSGKSTLLAAARQAWEGEGYTVKGAALSGIAAENLEAASGIKSRTLASYEYAWKDERDPLGHKDILVIDEAGMIGSRQLERVLAAAEKARAKVVLVGDPEQLQAIEAGAAFRGVIGQAGMAEITQVRRQNESWAREATQQLATGRTREALSAFEVRGALTAAVTQEDAQRRLLEAWHQGGRENPDGSRLMLAYTRDQVRELNDGARRTLEEEGTLQGGESISTSRGRRAMAPGERVMFLRNERSLGVKNGTLGTLQRIDKGVLQVRLDDADETRVLVDSKFYQDLDYGYASTIHKSQGVTVDRTYVLAGKYFDRHASYVALSRHRSSAQLFYSQEEFGGTAGSQLLAAGLARQQLDYTMSRARPKELAHDYLDLESMREARSQDSAGRTDHPSPLDRSLEALQARAREAWAAMRAKGTTVSQSPEEVQRQARENWRTHQRTQAASRDQGRAQSPASHDRSQGEDDGQGL
jgi:Ti-type conjugative transfer relaxase TraA